MIKSQKTANLFAKKMARLMKESGLYVPLHACLEYVAQAAGFASWQALARTGAFAVVDEAKFYNRLLETVPFACRPAINAWRAGEPLPETVEGYPARWYLDAIPYFLATMALHRRTSVLRPGSGAGQRMRAQIVDHLTMTWAQNGFAAPLFDPVNFDFVFQGRADDIFADLADLPAFERERDRLVDEGILKLLPKMVRLATPGIEGVKAHAIWSRADKVKMFIDNDPSNIDEPLYEALSLIGVGRAREIVEALLSYGDKRYIIPSGSLREVLSQIANDGDLTVFVHTLNVFAHILPLSARELRDAVPAKILNEFVARNQKVSIAGAFRWMQNNPDWADRLRRSADRPAKFTLAVTTMVEEMRAA